MESPPFPVLAEIFKVHLEKTLMPELEKFMTPWKRYVDNTITYINPDFIMNAVKILNKLHENIKLTYVVEQNVKI